MEWIHPIPKGGGVYILELGNSFPSLGFYSSSVRKVKNTAATKCQKCKFPVYKAL